VRTGIELSLSMHYESVRPTRRRGAAPAIASAA
jgi:hypothetical protein